MKAPSEEIYSKSMACDFLLTERDWPGCITYCCEILSHTEVENSHFRPLFYSDCRP